MKSIITILFVLTFGSSVYSQSFQQNEAIYRKSYLVKLSQSLAQYAKKGSKVLVIHSYDEKPASIKRLELSLSYISEGFGDKLTVTKSVNPFPERDDYMEISGESLNKIITENNECDVIIFLSSLPYSLKELQKMTFLNNPKKIVGVTVSTNLRSLKSYILKKQIDVAIAWNPQADLTRQVKTLPDDLNEVFNHRYLAISYKNVESIAETNKRFFKDPK